MTDENALKQLKRMKAERSLQADEYNAIVAGILALKEKINNDIRYIPRDIIKKIVERVDDYKCHEIGYIRDVAIPDIIKIINDEVRKYDSERIDRT